MSGPDNMASLERLHAEWHEKMRLEALANLTGAPLEFQRAGIDLHKAFGDMFNSFLSAGSTSAISISVLLFERVEALTREVAALKAEMKQPAWTRREGERE